MERKKKIIVFILGLVLFLTLCFIITNFASSAETSQSASHIEKNGWPRDNGKKEKEFADTAQIGQVDTKPMASKQRIKNGPDEIDKEGSSETSMDNNMYAYITGAVMNPGLYEIHEGMTLGQLVKSAGGLLPYAGTNEVNLASLLEAGKHVHIPFSFTGSPEELLRSQKLNVNTATEKELEALPGIGPAMAKRMIEYRESNGKFTDIGDLKKVKGIGPALLTKIKDQVRVD